jgi:hypothetical protein
MNIKVKIVSNMDLLSGGTERDYSTGAAWSFGAFAQMNLTVR